MNTTDNLRNQRNLWLVQAALFIRRRLSAVHSALMRTFVTGLIVFLLCSQHCAAQKIGYINTDSVLVRMPEYHAVQDSLVLFQQMVDSTMRDMELEYQRKTREADSILKVWEENPPATVKVHYPSDYALNVEEFQIAADEEKKLLSERLVNRLMSRIDSAVEIVARAGGYTYVLDLADTVLLYKDPAHDLLIAVCNELRLPVPYADNSELGTGSKSAASLKTGHVNVDSLMKMMPAYKVIEDTLTELSARCLALLVHKEEVFILKIALLDSLKRAGYCNPKVIQQREVELAQLQIEYQTLAALMASELKSLRDSLLADLSDTIQSAISAVALGGGYTYVVDSSDSSACLYADPEEDLFLPVCKQLGIVLPQSQPSPK